MLFFFSLLSFNKIIERYKIYKNKVAILVICSININSYILNTENK